MKPDITFSGRFSDFQKILSFLLADNYNFLSKMCYQKSTTFIHDASNIYPSFTQISKIVAINQFADQVAFFGKVYEFLKKYLRVWQA